MFNNIRELVRLRDGACIRRRRGFTGYDRGRAASEYLRRHEWPDTTCGGQMAGNASSEVRLGSGTGALLRVTPIRSPRENAWRNKDCLMNLPGSGLLTIVEQLLWHDMSSKIHGSSHNRSCAKMVGRRIPGSSDYTIAGCGDVFGSRGLKLRRLTSLHPGCLKCARSQTCQRRSRQAGSPRA